MQLTFTNPVRQSLVDKTVGLAGPQKLGSEDLPAWADGQNTLLKSLPRQTIESLNTPLPHITATENTKPFQSKLLDAANTVIVVGWSSMGLGHTERVFGPIREAVQMQELRKDDVVVLHIPVPWGDEQKRASANASLNRFRLFLQEHGIHVICVKSDKTIRSAYRDDDSDGGKKGHSYNEAAMADLAVQAFRDIGPPREIHWDGAAKATQALPNTELTEEHLQGLPIVNAYNVIGSLLRTLEAGPHGKAARKKLRVLDDMDPALPKAARKLGVLPGQTVSQSNHANLFVLPNSVDAAELQEKVESNRPYFIWSKMQYGGADHIQASISPARNTLAGFRGTAEAVKVTPGITEETQAADARQKIISHFMQVGIRVAVDTPYESGPGIIVKDACEPKNVVLLYVQDLTQAYVRRIQEKMQSGDADFCDTLFVICAPGSFAKESGINPLQHGTFANAGIVMAGGYGTTSEAWYASQKGYQGLITVMPVPYQREQETNAEKLKLALPGKVRIATATDWPTHFDQMVQDGVKQTLVGNMRYLFEAIDNQDSNARHTMQLLFGTAQPSDEESMMNAVLSGIRQDPIAKGFRRLMVKVLVPLFSQLKITGQPAGKFSFRMTAKDHTVVLSNLAQVRNTLKDAAKLKSLIGVDLSGKGCAFYVKEALDVINDILGDPDVPEDQRVKPEPEKIKEIATEFLLQLGQNVSAGS